jgi:hypothetical protein
MKNTGINICVYLTTLLITLQRVADWDCDVFEENLVSTQYEVMNISGNNHDPNDIATVFKRNFKSKNFDHWAQNATFLYNIVAVIQEFKQFLSPNQVSKKHINQPELNGTIIVNLLWSSSQQELFSVLVQDKISQYLNNTERVSTTSSEGILLYQLNQH